MSTGLEESDLDITDRYNPDPTGTVARFMGFGAALWATGEITEAIGGGLQDGLFTEVGAMPEGSSFDAVNAELAALQPAPAPQVAPTADANANNPFMLPDKPGGMGGPV